MLRPRSLSRPMILALPTLVRSRKEQRKRRERMGRILGVGFVEC